MITTELLYDIVNQAVKHGATEAEVTSVESTQFQVEVRLGEVEKLQEAASRGLGLRVLYQGRQASSSTSDLSPRAIDELISSTVEMAKLTSVDDAAALPYGDELAREIPDLSLYDASINALTTERKIEMARSAEEAARGADPRIANSEGSACSTVTSKSILVTSAGFTGEYKGTICALTVAPIAKESGQMQVAAWGDRQRSLESLESPETLGREAARRVLRKLNGRKIQTQEAPIVFESSVAEELLADFFVAVDGYSIFRRASFLVGRLGETVAAPALTIIDDGKMRGAVGSRPFDGEGLATKRTAVVENGILKSYLLDTYTARKLGLRSTGSATRALTGAPVVGFSNFFIAPGVYQADEIISSVKNGFYVTEMIGFGFNAVTGDFSRGASGWWIEDGKLAFPVEEVTIAGNFRDMLRGIEMIGNDLRFRGRTAAPTIKIDRMMVSGE